MDKTTEKMTIGKTVSELEDVCFSALNGGLTHAELFGALESIKLSMAFAIRVSYHDRLGGESDEQRNNRN